MVSSTVNDLSYALRQMRLAPVLTITIVLTLGLGIGATTAIFSLIHAVMLRLIAGHRIRRAYFASAPGRPAATRPLRRENGGFSPTIFISAFANLRRSSTR